MKESSQHNDVVDSKIHRDDQIDVKRKKNVCHALPCTIEYDQKAAVHMYFQPQSIDRDDVQAVQFRGRGLLCANPEQPLPTNVRGMVVMATDGSPHLVPTDQFDSFSEWRHEHSVNRLLNEPKSTSLISRLQDLVDVSHAIHDPIPL